MLKKNICLHLINDWLHLDLCNVHACVLNRNCGINSMCFNQKYITTYRVFRWFGNTYYVQLVQNVFRLSNPSVCLNIFFSNQKAFVFMCIYRNKNGMNCL